MKLGTAVSQDPFSSRHGVRQGCPLSPLLFNIIFDRVLRTALPQMRGVTLLDEEMEEWKVKVQAYADDVVLFARSMEDAQHDMNVLSDAFAAAGLVVSVAKTKVMQLPDKRPPAALPPEIKRYGTGLFMQAPSGRRFRCPLCPEGSKPLSATSALQRHLLDCHGALKVAIDKEEPRQKEVLPDFAMDPTTQRYICPSCNTANLRAASLTRSRWRHTGWQGSATKNRSGCSISDGLWETWKCFKKHTPSPRNNNRPHPKHSPRRTCASMERLSARWKNSHTWVGP